VADLKAAYAKAAKMDIHRLSFKKDGNRLEKDSDTLDLYEVKPNDSLEMKDLGPQIGYRTVFVIEYFGPMLFVLLYALRPAFVYGAAASSVPYKRAALVGIACWVAAPPLPSPTTAHLSQVIHFLKRELETFFVHKFSRPTMPLSNLFKNCAYYWSFGAIIGLAHSLSLPPSVGRLTLLRISSLPSRFCLSICRRCPHWGGSFSRRRGRESDLSRDVTEPSPLWQRAPSPLWLPL
jgi:hypothetical protein